MTCRRTRGRTSNIAHEAFLPNERTLEDPEVIDVERNGEVRRRIINAPRPPTSPSISEGSLVSVDGNPVVPLSV